MHAAAQPCVLRGSNLRTDLQPELSPSSLPRYRAVCGSPVHSEQPHWLAACTGAGRTLGGRNVWVKPLHMGQRSWITPFLVGNFLFQAPLALPWSPGASPMQRTGSALEQPPRKTPQELIITGVPQHSATFFGAAHYSQVKYWY